MRYGERQDGVQKVLNDRRAASDTSLRLVSTRTAISTQILYSAPPGVVLLSALLSQLLPWRVTCGSRAPLPAALSRMPQKGCRGERNQELGIAVPDVFHAMWDRPVPQNAVALPQEVALVPLCAVTALVCAWLLLRAYGRSHYRLLLWSGICFVGFTVNNTLVILDKAVFPDINMSTSRLIVALIGMLVLVYGLIWDTK